MSRLKKLNEHAPLLNVIVTLLGIVAVVVIAILGWLYFDTRITEVYNEITIVQQDINETKEKIAEFDELFAKNLSSDRFSVLCPEGKGAHMTFLEEDGREGMVIECE